MKQSMLVKSLSLAALGCTAVITTLALAEPSKDKPGAGAMPPLPPGWTEADMQACAVAAMPGPMHEHLQGSTGVWEGKTSMWMAPGMPAMNSTCTSTITPAMDGRFVKCEYSGDMPGMGPFKGMGINGFDNVSGKFQSTWIDNMGTGIMFGTGELSADKKVLTWNYNFNCPVTKKPAVMRLVETSTGKDSMKLEMYTNDPKSGKEYKMMEIVFTRKPAAAAGGK